jgi:hypothetical protein
MRRGCCCHAPSCDFQQKSLTNTVVLVQSALAGVTV